MGTPTGCREAISVSVRPDSPKAGLQAGAAARLKPGLRGPGRLDTLGAAWSAQFEGVQEYGDGAVVVDLHLHVGAEAAGRYRHTHLF
jgi:hypothetical protein